MWIKKATAFFNDVKKERLRILCLELLGPRVWVSINEVNCPEPDCPPVKTVILIMENDKPTRSCVVHKTINEISKDDIVHVLASSQGEAELQTQST